MTTVRLSATGAVSAFGGTGGVVGSAPQWNDGSDTTYGYGLRNETSTAQAFLQATLEPLPSSFTSVSSITLHVRVRVENSGDAAGDAPAFFAVFPDTFGQDAFVEATDTGQGNLRLPSTGAIYDWTSSTIKDAFSTPIAPSDLFSILQAGANIQVYRGGFHGSSPPWTLDLYVYELWLEVEGTGSTPPAPAVRSTPSLRMLQRGGSGGMSGIPRMVGDPTRRGSLRQGPGSVY